MFEDLLSTSSSIISKASYLGISDLKLRFTKFYEFSGKEIKERTYTCLNGKGNNFLKSQLEFRLSEEEAKKVDLEIDVALKAGDSFPSLSVFKISDGEAVTLSFNDNKIYLVEFWATWNDENMQHNQEMLEKNTWWVGNAEIIAVALDDDKKDPYNRIKKKRWNNISSYWAGEEGFRSPSALSLGIEGVPSCFLVSNRKILWSGHPDKVDVEKLISEGALGVPLSLPPPPSKAGDSCPVLTVLDTNTEEAVTLTWPEDDNKVYLINFWTTCCGPSQKPMKHHQNMLSSHPEWADKFSILAISLDDSRNEVIERYTEKGWTLIRNLWVGPKEFDELAPKAFGIDDIPTSVLVHKGKILWKGDPKERKLEQDVEALLKGEPFTECQQAENVMNKEELKGRFEALKKVYEEFVSANPYTEPPLINFNAKLAQTLFSHKETQESYIDGEYYISEKELITSLFDKIKEIFPGTDSNLTFVPPAATCERGIYCSLCNSRLMPYDTQYQCLYCDPKHYHCENCEKVVKEGVAGSAKFAHPHSVFMIHPAAQKLDYLKYGASTHEKTEFTEDQESNDIGGLCDNRHTELCDGDLEGVRYKCAHCTDYDYCQGCQEKYEAREEKTIAWADSHCHRPWHIMIKMRIP